MNRENRLIKILDEDGGYLRNIELQKKMQLSENTIRSSIKIINLASSKNGFHIVHTRNKGYKLIIDDNELYVQYKNRLFNDVDYSQSWQRQNILMFYLLQKKSYTTIDYFAEKSGISRATIVKDINDLENRIKQIGLSLERKKHYGVRLIGDEKDIRKAFSKYVFDNELYNAPIKEYQEFHDSVNKPEIKEVIYQILKNKVHVVSDLAFENLWQHYTVLLYRCMQENFITLDEISTQEIQDEYLKVAEEIAIFTKEKLSIVIPNNEIKYFAIDFQSKCVVDNMNDIDLKCLRNAIDESLLELDKEYYSVLSEDNELKKNLVLHIYPLITRMNYNFQLENPMIDEINMGYSNIFTMTLRFMELLSKKVHHISQLSRDEIGFITLHIAASIEKSKQQKLEKIKKIVVICSTGRGTAMLIKIKLESIFFNAKVITTSQHDLSLFDHDLPDIFLSTIPLFESYLGVPIISFKGLLNKEEINQLKEMVALQYIQKQLGNISNQVLSLFKEEYFQIVESSDYMKIIRTQAEKMVEMKDACEQYPNFVIEREMLYPTIFMNGIATPHPIRLNAINNSVGITIVKGHMEYESLEIKLIFLINLKSESLYLHQELQRLILKLIENDTRRQNILSAQNYEAFIFELKKFV